MTTRKFSFFDKICLGIDQAVRALTNNTQSTGVPYPAASIPEATLNEKERKHAAALMRINHTGEVCAQALYQGQALAAKTETVKTNMLHAALEEGDHLTWCQQRLSELNSRTSYLNPFWYAGSFCIGFLAGKFGEDWNLGFVAETETQVIRHLEKHLNLLPSQDKRSQQILTQMQADEAKHRDQAVSYGAATLPSVIKAGMTMSSKLMVNTTYYI